AYGMKGFRVGVNLGYLFGSKRKNIQTIYPDTAILFNSHERERIGYGAFFLDGGVQADIKLSEGFQLKLGLSGGLQSDLKAKKDYLLETYSVDGNLQKQ